jgi:purine-binding chemotaxis protein CheW
MSEQIEQSSEANNQFVTFRSGDQEFGADIMAIREIRGWTPTTPLPHSPNYVRGVINLRGIVLPIVDLKARLGYSATETNAKNVIVVVKCGSRTIGLLVDAVSDILTTTAAEIQPAPDIARDETCQFINGIAVLGDRMVTILDMDVLTASLVTVKDQTVGAA